MNQPTIWILGSSLCLPFNLDDSYQAWPDIISKKTQIKNINLAKPGADNFFIYHSYLENLSNINSQDIVIIGWSHYSRKSFVLDRANQNQTNVIDSSLLYTTTTKEFIRNNNSPVGVKNWLTMKPKHTKIPYYNNWFDNYYSAYEQKCNFQAYLDSVKLTCPGHYVPFFFSKESVVDIDVDVSYNGGYICEFIIDNDVAISPTDAHLNQQGHKLWADHIIKTIDFLT